tara:strand:+ start:4372 stop:4773 length:402 start_codon:yes stop_codon:yes gene_type:complete
MTAIFWKKLWIWIKHYWYIPVIVLLILISFLSGKGIKNKYFDLMQKQKKNYKEEIDIINQENKVKEEKKKEVILEKEKTVEKIEEKFEAELEELKIRKKEEVAKTAEEHKDRPDDLAKKVAEVLSSEYIKNKK